MNTGQAEQTRFCLLGVVMADKTPMRMSPESFDLMMFKSEHDGASPWLPETIEAPDWDGSNDFIEDESYWRDVESYYSDVFESEGVECFLGTQRGSSNYPWFK